WRGNYNQESNLVDIVSAFLQHTPWVKVRLHCCYHYLWANVSRLLIQNMESNSAQQQITLHRYDLNASSQFHCNRNGQTVYHPLGMGFRRRGLCERRRWRGESQRSGRYDFQETAVQLLCLVPPGFQTSCMHDRWHNI